MKEEKLYNLFNEIDCDLEEPAIGHEERFLEKLKGVENGKKTGDKGSIRSLWTPWLFVAASIVFILFIVGSFINVNALTKPADLATVSLEMKNTHEFYSSVIKAELAKVNLAKSPETQNVVEDALLQLERLDEEYKKLREDLSNSGKDKRVIFAMVSNLQQRIDILNNVLTQIEEIKELKNNENESIII